MKFYLATVLLAALCALTFAEDEDMKPSWIPPMKVVNDSGPVGGRPENRIIGGRNARLGQIPYQASLLVEVSGGTFLCGGTLIAPNWIVTAANCAFGALSFRVRLGTLNYYQGGQYFYTTEKFIHRDFVETSPNNNIALIRLPNNAVILSEVHPIVIADVGLTFSSVRISGWGSNYIGQISSTLKFADLKNWDIAQCARSHVSDVFTIDDKNVCTVSSIGESPCTGDNGGPLVDNTSKQLVGLFSFVSDKGCLSGAPAVYIRVAAYRSWIREITRINYL